MKFDNGIYKPYNRILESCSSYSFPIEVSIRSGIDVKRFISDKYVNLFFDNSYLDIYEQDYYFRKQDVFDFKCERLYSYKIPQAPDRVRYYLYEYLKNGYMVIGHFNEYYIPGSERFQTKDNDNVYMLTDADQTANKLYYVIINQGKFKNCSTTFDDYFKSILGLREESIYLTFIRSKNTSTKIDIDSLRLDLEDYIKSTNRKNIMDDDKVFGINAIKAFSEYIMNQQDRLKLTDFFVLRDHKLMMKMRFDYLEHEGYLRSIEWKSKIQSIIDECNSCIYSCEKYGGERFDSFKLLIAQSFEKIIYEEKELLIKILERGLVL